MSHKTTGQALGALFVLFTALLLIAERTPPIIAGLTLICAALPLRGQDLRLSLAGVLRARRAAAVSLACLGFLCLWMLVSAVWSVAGMEAWARAPRIVAMIAVAAALPLAAALLPPGAARPARAGAAAAASLAVVLLLVETLFDMPLLRSFRYLAHGEVFISPPPANGGEAGLTYIRPLYLANRLSHIAAAVAILTLPAAALMWRRGARAAAVAIVGAGAVGLAGAPTGAPAFALACGALLAACAWLPAGSRRLLDVLTGAGIVAMPLLLPALVDLAAAAGWQPSDPSIVHRFGIWSHVSALIREHPLAGYGIEASRVFGRMGGDLGALVPDSPVAFAALPLHPHNAALQVWLELGAAGAAAFAGMWAGAVHLAAFAPPGAVSRAGALGGVFAALAIAHLSFGIWQFWWVAVLGLCAGMIVLLLRPDLDAAAETGPARGTA